MPLISLSICIPTYNFGKFLGQTLDSILPNLADDVEVVILDGGSTDDTANVVAQRQRDFPQIQYHRQEFRGGLAGRLLSLVPGGLIVHYLGERLLYKCGEIRNEYRMETVNGF